MTVQRRTRKNAAPDRKDAKRGSMPVPRLSGRKIIVVLGSDDAAISIASRTLHVLGAEMIETTASEASTPIGDAWTRPWIAESGAEMLQVIDRGVDNPAHALPFPAAWWRKPGVQKLKNGMMAELERSMNDGSELWGFGDRLTARLLPVWNEIFDRLGLVPIYVWALTNPAWIAPAAGGMKRDASPPELLWLAYQTDIFRYAGERLGMVLDHDDWSLDPQHQIERLTKELPLRWRGTSLELFESLTPMLEAEDASRAKSAPVLPLCRRFHDAMLRLGDDPDARAEVASIVQNTELLRPLVAPFLSSAATPRQDGDATEVASLRNEIEALRQTLVELRQAEDDDQRESLSGLRHELEAREREIRWLHEQYRERLRQAEADVVDAREASGRADPATKVENNTVLDENRLLKAEITTLTNASERYLARIYELKKMLEASVGGAAARE